MEWRKIYIEGIKSNYSISENGYLRNDDTDKIRKISYTRQGYIRYYFGRVKGKAINKNAHRLVAEYFIEATKEERKLHINHIDGIKDNNHYTNLEYVTPKENTKHAIKTGLYNPSEQDTKKIVLVYNLKGMFIEEIDSISSASRKFNNGDVGSISEICNKKNGAKQANGYQFRFKDSIQDIEDISNLTSGVKQTVLQYTLQNEYIQSFNTITEANKYLGKHSSSSAIGQCCKGNAKTAYGYKWKYKNI